MKEYSGDTGRKQIGLNMIANVLSYSANIVISFVLTPFLINTLGAETYSFYPMANTIISYMSVLTNSMNSMSSRFVTVSLVKGDEENANKYFNSVLASNILMCAALLIPMLIIVLFLDVFMNVPVNSVAAIKGLFLLVFVSALLNILASVYGIATFAKNRIDLRSIRELVTAVLRLVLFFLMYKFMPPSIVYVGVVTLVVAAVNIVFQRQYTKFLLPEISISYKYISKPHIKELLGASVWNAINTFGNTLLAGMSMILANMFYGAEAAGTYSIVQTVPQFISGVIVMLVGVFYPVITYKYAQNDKQGLVSELQLAQKFVGIFGASVIVVFSALATEFFELWTPGYDSSELSLLSFITILPHILISCIWPLTNLNVVMNKVKIPAVFTLVMGIANVLIAWVVYVIARPGVVSLPIISTILQCIWIGIFVPLYACYNLKVGIGTVYSTVIRVGIVSVGIFLLIIRVKKVFVLETWITFILFGGSTGVISLIAMALVVLGPKKIKQTLIKNIKGRR